MKVNYYLTVAALLCSASIGSASVLVFTNGSGASFGNGTSIPDSYGDRVTALSDAIGTYGLGNGFTPNVTIQYGQYVGGTDVQGSLLAWSSGYAGGLTDVAYGGDTNANAGDYSYVRFIADAGVLVRLNSFDLGNFGGRAVSTNVSVTSDLSGINPLTAFSTTGGDLFTSYTPGITGNVVTLRLSGSFFNVGLDNVNFDQIGASAVPEPATFALAFSALAGLAIRRMKRV